MSIETYTDPVAQLLHLGGDEQFTGESETNYVQQFGFTSEHIPELIRMATDAELNQLDFDRLEVWAPVHAWWSLAQLKAEAAIDPLINLFATSEDDWSIMDIMPNIFGQMGEIALPALGRYLADASQDEWARIIAADCILKIAEVNPDCREATIALLVQQLDHYTENGGNLNSSLINNLTLLKAVEAAPLIEQAFGTGEIDEFLTGSWARVQVDLGLKQESDFSSEELQPKVPPQIQKIRENIETWREMTAAEELQPTKPAGFGTPKPANPKKSGKKKKK